MILQAGKRYVRRDGTISPPLENFRLGFIDPVILLIYGKTGKEHDAHVLPATENYPHQPHPKDLMKEYEE